jgi:uncharacterized protein involved in exopolysaccharide biosynthesis
MSTNLFDEDGVIDSSATETPFQEYGAILQRRWKTIALAAAMMFILIFLVAMLLPPVYKSAATILIQEQEIPQDLVRSTITSFADERIQVISQQVLVRTVLLALIDKYNLYPNRRNSLTNEELLDKMRDDIKLQPISTDVTDRRSGAQIKATIAFKLSYESNSPDKAQKITNELVTLFLNENLKNREERAAETSSFLSEESDRLARHIAEVEGQLAGFKAKNEGKLPELTQLNLQLSDRNANELLRVEHDITETRDRHAALESELALTSPNNALPGTNGVDHLILQPEDELKSKKAQLAAIEGAYTEDHPDVRRLKREIASLEANGAGPTIDDQRDKQLASLKAELEKLRHSYTEDHPDVIRTRLAIEALQRSQARTSVDPDRRIRADNPVYLNLRSQIDSGNAELAALLEERQQLLSKQRQIERNLEQTPEVEREYLELSRDHENSQVRYRELKQKQMEAEVAQQLEQDRKGERFTLIEPPQYPERPTSPNRLVIVLAGFVFSLVGGMTAGGVREALDSTVKGSSELVRILRVPVLSVIPATLPENYEEQARRQQWFVIGAVLMGLVIVMVLVHFFFMPLDILWYSFLRRSFG